MVKHALDWMFNMLDELSKELGNLYDVSWMAVTPHPSIFVPKKKYRSVKQWSGKEYRNAASIMLAVLEATLETFVTTAEQQEIIDSSLDCICGLLDFYLMAQYKSHSVPVDQPFDNEYRAQWDGTNQQPDPNDTVSYLQHYLAVFHNNKKAFLKYRASKKVKKDAKAYAEGSVRVIEPEVWVTMTKKAQNQYILETAKEKKAHIQEYLEEHSDYKMPKVHTLTHFGEIIWLFGVLTQFSTSIVE